MPKTPTKVLREINNLIIVKDKGTPTASDERRREKEHDDLSKTASEDREAREKNSRARIRSDPIRSDQRERERQFFVFYSLCVIFDIIIIVWCNHHHSPSRKTRGKKGKKERKKERKRVEMMKTMKMMKKKNTV